MNKEQIRREIEKKQVELNNKITSREKILECQKLSEELDQLIAMYMEL